MRRPSPRSSGKFFFTAVPHTVAASDAMRSAVSSAEPDWKYASASWIASSSAPGGEAVSGSRPYFRFIRNIRRTLSSIRAGSSSPASTARCIASTAAAGSGGIRSMSAPAFTAMTAASSLPK
ncbi:hypothetical protein [Paenibacillus dendritiformis]|nr:hypothetical protein [Paenibacillus dendritiformis]